MSSRLTRLRRDESGVSLVLALIFVTIVSVVVAVVLSYVDASFRNTIVLLTSNLVVSETATRLRYDAGPSAAIAFRGLLEAAVEAGRLIVRHADGAVDSSAWDLMERYPDLTLS